MAKTRLRKYPDLFAECRTEGAAYAACVVKQENVTRNSCGFIIRLGIIVYGCWHDQYFNVPFTDIDYKVFTDAARHVVHGGSPYERHTYRYPPLLAWLLVPNILIHITWGKLLFSFVDVLISILIYALVKFQGYSDRASQICSFTWIFNPLSIIIATRGNSDSIIALVVLLSVYFISRRQTFLSGMFLALAIHIRLYPIVFSLPLYLSIKSKEMSQQCTETGCWNRMIFYLKRTCLCLFPNKTQFILVISCISTLILLTASCYFLYGQQYLQESIFYHLTRKDTRHNFSVYFYLLYLQPQQHFALMFAPQFILLILFSFMYGKNNTILFCLFLQTFTIVTYNPVLTSQYFIWYLSLLPPSLPRFNLKLRQAAILCSLWIFSQLTWLIPAYLLEYRGKNTFIYIWFQGIGFFCANLAIMVRLIKSYVPDRKKLQ
ncbi:UNVERIFIED_CONTAM: hypothetical protein PYX00_006321 [Menopon gallinae]|uniref:GPI alpha-1,4-mannosyltransferase I, catalytic subunit n=1 Tax=Menopon gallinae TaxID=328185 RepID=A0AAW2HUN4_9NEOP